MAGSMTQRLKSEAVFRNMVDRLCTVKISGYWNAKKAADIVSGFGGDEAGFYLRFFTYEELKPVYGCDYLYNKKMPLSSTDH
ncbi:hypothetical protein HMPREF0322_05454 [Desulfitobacterium hafniense DP7]|uniref:Uncharacterized protein n=1 Tax=Desulfitobacterium hafniense DP7 TaxID=537010 RepID=G9XWT7_DESHA|nr:hypothetical protein [Desulfitobacterium hafniense]EHL03886.1 hypothetical protein HMPREF0322_05454 [Desulfitobacterium hafniense DP7]